MLNSVSEVIMHKDLKNWQDMWEKAQAEMGQDQKSPSQEFRKDLVPQQPEKSEFSSVDKEYWDAIYKASKNPSDAPDPLEVFNEDLSVETPKPVKPNQSKEELGGVAKGRANAANPIDPASIGKDQDYKPNLADAGQLEQLHNLKINLYELECKLNTNDCLAKTQQGKKIQGQIKRLKSQIDELSDNITPDFLQSYLS
jgi:hypothetical protein